MKYPVELITQTATLSFAMAFAYFLSGVVAIEIFTQNSIVTVAAFAPEGFALAGVLLFGRSVLPGIFLGQILLALYQWSDPIGSTAISVINTVEAYLAWYLAKRFKLDTSLPRLRDVLGLLMAIVFILQPFSALLGNAVLLTSGIIKTPESFISSLFSWWLDNVMGQILFTPTLLLLYHRFRSETAGLILGSIVISAGYAYLLLAVWQIQNPMLLMLVTLVPALTLAVYDRTLATLSVATLAAVTFMLTINDERIFSYGKNLYDNLVNLDIYLLSHMALVLIIGTLIEEKNRLLKRLHSIAHYDYLTALPNRYLLREEIHRSVTLCKVSQTKSAICFIDIDDFKPINDTFGHHVGDEVLVELTRRLQSTMDIHDALLRIGGDEFLLIINRLEDDETLRQRLETLRTLVTRPITLKDKEHRISVSIGVACIPDDGVDVKSVMECADSRMYRAKQVGKNRIVYT